MSEEQSKHLLSTKDGYILTGILPPSKVLGRPGEVHMMLETDGGLFPIVAQREEIERFAHRILAWLSEDE